MEKIEKMEKTVRRVKNTEDAKNDKINSNKVKSKPKLKGTPRNLNFRRNDVIDHFPKTVRNSCENQRRETTFNKFKINK